jgi:hypothetical protein
MQKWQAITLTETGAAMQWIYLALIVLAGFSGSFFGAYFKKKGENRAIREDIEKLTKTTKEIEAKISSDVWDRQKRWELKREVLFEATKRLSEADDALLSYDSVLQVEQKENKTNDVTWAESKHERIMKWSKASANFDETRELVGLVCGKETYRAFEDFGGLINKIAAEISSGDVEIYRKTREDFYKKLFLARLAMRRELGIDSPG